MKKLYLDTETCGLHGMPVLIQYAIGDGPICLYEPWKNPVSTTLAVLDDIARHIVVGFKLTFDWFQLVKLRAVFSLCNPEWIPEQHIDEIAALEDQAKDADCFKPAGALDLMLHSRKGPFQSLMARDPVRVKRVPTSLADKLAAELNSRLPFEGIYFARDKEALATGKFWKVFDRKRRNGTTCPDFKDVVLKFKPSGSLKSLAEHVMDESPAAVFGDIAPPSYPIEYGFAPTASAVSTAAKNWEVHEDGKLKGHAWPGLIRQHIAHWHSDEKARQYANDDIKFTRGLDKQFGYPEPCDDDSILACMVAAIRWRGYEINVPGIIELLAKAQTVLDGAPCNVNKPSEVREYLSAAMALEELLVSKLEDSTSKDRLEDISKWWISEPEPCSKCQDGDDLSANRSCDGLKLDVICWCARCNGTGQLAVGEHPAATRAKHLLTVKRAAKEKELYNKLLRAGRLHADFVIIGAKSSRMSGAGGLNAQAVKKTKEVRKNFPLAWPGYVLSGGDFDSFEVSIAAAVYDDAELTGSLLSDKKIHALFGEIAYQVSYEAVVDSEGSSELDMYTRAKSGVFLDMFGGEAPMLAKTLNISNAEAERTKRDWNSRYPNMGLKRQRIADSFGCMRQTDGVGSAISWRDPHDAAETLLGFKRFFTLENQIIHGLYQLANHLPEPWRASAERVMRDTRRSRVQTVGGAVSSAIYAAAFAIAAGNVRAAGNHEIQGTGAGITKALQRRIWDLQPVGVHPFRVAPMNIHDEIMCPTLPEYVEAVAQVVKQTVEQYRRYVPLLGMTWFRKLASWAGKKGGGAEGKLSISPPKPASLDAPLVQPQAATSESANHQPCEDAHHIAT